MMTREGFVTGLRKEELGERIAELAPWFHNMKLGDFWTAPDHFLGDHPASKFKGFTSALPQNLSGRSVLDIGCNGGFYAIEMKRRGADRVLAIDTEDRYLEQARLAAQVYRCDIEFRNLSVYDVGAIGETFDLVLFMGVLYHLRHPMLALDLIHAHVAKDLLLFQSLQRGSREIPSLEPDYPFEEIAVFEDPGFPRLHFIEHEYAHDWTNWWIPNRAAAEAMLRASGFGIEAAVAEDVYLCRRLELPRGQRGQRAVYPAKGRSA